MATPLDLCQPLSRGPQRPNLQTCQSLSRHGICLADLSSKPPQNHGLFKRRPQKNISYWEFVAEFPKTVSPMQPNNAIGGYSPTSLKSGSNKYDYYTAMIRYWSKSMQQCMFRIWRPLTCVCHCLCRRRFAKQSRQSNCTHYLILKEIFLPQKRRNSCHFD